MTLILAPSSSTYRELADLRDQSVILEYVDRLSRRWSEQFETSGRIFLSYSSRAKSPLSVARDEIVGLVNLVLPNADRPKKWEYFVQKGKGSFLRWHFDPVPLSMVHFGDVATTNICVGRLPKKLGSAPSREAILSVGSGKLFRLEPTDYHQRGETLDPTKIRQVVTFYY